MTRYLNQEWLNELMWANTPQWQKDQLNEEREDDRINREKDLDNNRAAERL